MPGLFGPLYREGWLIKFAHRTFAWDSEAPGKAAVHCVIVGFTRNKDVKPRLWDYKRVNAAPEPVKVETGINAYLVDGPNVLVTKRSRPLSPEVVSAVFGSKPVDQGNLIVETEDLPAIQNDPIAAKYLRSFCGSRELVRGIKRWCLWMAGSDFDPSDLARSDELQKRIEAVRDFRAASKKAATRELASLPYRFAEVREPKSDYLCVPSVVSEGRPFFTASQLTVNTITSNLAFMVEDSTGLAFGLVSSSMFITWQRAVGGRLKSDLRFSNTLTWNTFPVPELTEEQRERIIKAGKRVLEARALHPERSLAEHYNPLAMDPALLEAHKILDREVDKAFGAPKRLQAERQRQELLFANYARLVDEK